MSATRRPSTARWPASRPSSRRSTGFGGRDALGVRAIDRDGNADADRRRGPSRRRARRPALDPRRVDRPPHRALPDEGRGRGSSQGIGPVVDDRPTDRVPGDLAGDRRAAAGRDREDADLRSRREPDQLRLGRGRGADRRPGRRRSHPARRDDRRGGTREPDVRRVRRGRPIGDRRDRDRGPRPAPDAPRDVGRCSVRSSPSSPVRWRPRSSWTPAT